MQQEKTPRPLVQSLVASTYLSSGRAIAHATAQCPCKNLKLDHEVSIRSIPTNKYPNSFLQMARVLLLLAVLAVLHTSSAQVLNEIRPGGRCQHDDTHHAKGPIQCRHPAECKHLTHWLDPFATMRKDVSLPD